MIAAIHGACVGGAVDLICSTDIRYCSSDAWFQIKEVDLGMTADVGTLQRLPKIIGSQSLVKELAYTGRKMSASEALQAGFVNHVSNDQNRLVNLIFFQVSYYLWIKTYEAKLIILSLLEKALDVAKQIASKSPVAVQGTKLSLDYSRDHTVEEGLNHMVRIKV